MAGEIAIIGAGPAGMMAALQAAPSGARILLFDGNDRCGRKLAVTGSGRCNISNSQIDPRRYACAEGDFVTALLAQYGHAQLAEFLASHAVPIFSMADGWSYPRSESAAAVVAALTAALDLAGVELHLAEKVMAFHRAAGQWRLSAGEAYRVDRLIIASGGSAQPNLGSRGECDESLRLAGHTVLPPRPALAPVLADMRRLHKLQGVRMEIGLELWQGDRQIAATTGSAIFAQWGLNGPAAMDLSHHISARPEAELQLRINFIVGGEALMREQLEKFADSEWPAVVVAAALVPPKVAHFVLESAGLTAGAVMRQAGAAGVERILAALTSTRIRVLGTRGPEFAQVTAGGVPVTEVDPATMASRRAAGLYLAGEVLDVVGPCGGYNLQFAFSSGAIAGRAAGAA